jgi:hypothetical protein
VRVCVCTYTPFRTTHRHVHSRAPRSVVGWVAVINMWWPWVDVARGGPIMHILFARVAHLVCRSALRLRHLSKHTHTHTHRPTPLTLHHATPPPQQGWTEATPRQSCCIMASPHRARRVRRNAASSSSLRALASTTEVLAGKDTFSASP